MNRATEYLATHWFGVLLLGISVLLGGALLWNRRRTRTWSLPLGLFAAALGVTALGGMVVPPASAVWLASSALAALFFMFLCVVLTGRWSAYVGYTVAAFACLGIGGTITVAGTEALGDAWDLLRSVEVVQPWWLLLLLFVPVIILLSFRSLAGLGPVRKWLAIGLRCSLIIFLTLALAEVRLRHQNKNITVLFLVDRSLSIPQEYDPNDGWNPDSTKPRPDLRWERLKQFINEVVEKRGGSHKRDKVGMIVFGRRPRLELPPSDVPSFNFTEVASNIDATYTDIAAALKLALASFPEGSGKRIVLISDGNENLGNAVEQARLAAQNGAQIDVVPVAAGFRNENEVMVERIEAPPRTELGSRIPIRVLVRSANPNRVVGTLTLKQLSKDDSGTPQSVNVAPSPMRVSVGPGLNTFRFPQPPLAGQQRSYTFQAIFQPEGVEVEPAKPLDPLIGDRPQNNSATTHVVALGQRRILVVHQPPDPEHPERSETHEMLIEKLKGIGKSKFKVYSCGSNLLPQDPAELGVFLSDYDCIILANVPAEQLNGEQQRMLRDNTRDQGCGLVMVGGPDSFGAGGWQKTPVEEALPVDCDVKSFKVTGKGGLVLIMHGCEMADGNRWEKEIAKLAIKKLSPMDMVGVIDWDWGDAKWHIPFQEIGGKRESLLRLVDKMSAGDMMDYDPGLQRAYDALMDPKHDLAKKHIILLSDGDAQQNNKGLLARMRQNKITVTTVGVATHGPAQNQNLAAISAAAAPGGKFYNPTSPKALPEIYTKESRIVSQSFLDLRTFQPTLHERTGGPTDQLGRLPRLHGFVRTTAKPSVLVDMPIEGPPQGEQHFPILAFWHYGLGKSVAFTSDDSESGGRKFWAREWAESEIYRKFWEQVVDWASRAVETGRLTMTSEYRDGRVRVIVDARDKNNRPITDLNLRGAVTQPVTGSAADKKTELKFEQKNSGMYEVEFKAEEAGSYFITAQATKRVKSLLKDENGNPKEVEIEEGFDSIRSGVTIPYSPEFADLESNTALMERLREMTGGQSYEDNADSLAEVARSGDVFRSGAPRVKSLQPIWFWLVLLTGILLFFDVAVRRIAIEPLAVAVAAQRFWDRLRGHAVVKDTTPQFLDRLKSRKAQISEAIQKEKAGRRFEIGEAPPAVAPRGAHEVPVSTPRPTRRPEPQRGVGPEAEKEAADYASRLLKAKRKVWEERDKDKER